MSVTNNLYVLDRQTGAARKLTEDDDAKSSVRISPDGQWVLYCGCRISESTDSLRAYLLPVTDPGQRIHLGYAFWVQWVNDSEFAGWLWPYGFRGSVEKRSWERITPDSVGFLPVPGKQCNVVWDFRLASKGVWIKPISKGISEKSDTSCSNQLPRNSISPRGQTIFSTQFQEQVLSVASHFRTGKTS